MKIVFEYDDGTYRIIRDVTLIDIEARTVNNRLIDQYVCDKTLKNKYIISNDSRVGGFLIHRDVLKNRSEIHGLQEAIKLKEKVLEYYESFEDLSIQDEKLPITVEESAVNELFDYVIRRESNELHTRNAN